MKRARSGPLRPAGTPRRFAAIDLGSDTIHLLIADQSGSPDGGPLKVEHSESVLVELGRVVDWRGRITRTAEREVARVLQRMVRRAIKADAVVLIGATEACRQAANGAEVLARLAAGVNQPVHLLSAAREAELGIAGVRPELPGRGALVVIDSGGASTEVTLTQGRAIQAATSLPVGAALLAGGLDGDPPPPIDWALSSIRIGSTLSQLPAGRPRHAFATGGTAHGLLAMDLYRERHSSDSKVEVTLAQLEKTAAALLARPAARIGADSGIEPGRVALLAPGVLILAAILRHYRLVAFHVLAAGVREGMIRAAAADPEGWWRSAAGEPS